MGLNMSSNLSDKVNVIQGKIISLLNKKEELEKTDVMYYNCIEQTKEKENNLKELESFMFRDGLDIKKGIAFFGLLKLLVCLAFVFEIQFILFSKVGLFSLPIVETIIYNVLGIVLLDISNKTLKTSKRAKKISLNCFGDSVYDSKRIKERKDFYHLEKRRLIRKRFELEREVLQNDREVEELKSLLKSVLDTYNNEPNKTFLETISQEGNVLQQLMLSKRR